MDLSRESLHKLRGIAQSFGVPDIFEKDVLLLAQEIELKQKKLIPLDVPLPPKPEYDARLMTKVPAKRADVANVTTMLEPYILRGLKLRFDEEHWYMASGIKNDTGSIRMPPRVILECARRVMQ